jgi:hypothetical protein
MESDEDGPTVKKEGPSRGEEQWFQMFKGQ